MSQSRRWSFTVNNQQRDTIDVSRMEEESEYLILANEVAPTTGTKHIQGYVVFRKNKRLSAVKKLLPTSHWEVSKGTSEQNIKYCKKDGDFNEYGSVPKTPLEKGQDEKLRWKLIIEQAKQGTLEVENPSVFFKHYRTAKSLFQPPALEDNPNTCGVWYHGPSGSGKSKAARANYPGLYEKTLNKWWDNYDGEDHVLLDDFDQFHAPNMGSALKRYADHYPVRVEVKGSSMVIRPQTIVVTSQYTIEELFPEPELQAALLRRFKTTHFRICGKN